MSLRYLAGFITASYNPLKVPNAPTIGTATAGNAQATITFTAPSNVGGGAITGYIAVATKTSDGTAVSATGSASPITITGLTNGSAYTIQVAAVNAFGPSAYSAPSGSVTPVAPKLYSWGYNAEGQLGQNDRVYRSSPVQVGALTNWALAAGGYYFSLATKTDGTLWSWGLNNDGQLGLSDTIRRSSPVQVGALTNWSTVSASSKLSVAIKTDGTLWSWGINNSGQLGQNVSSAITLSSPAIVGALTNWLRVSAGYNSCAAIKTDGTLWTWGTATFGVLGTNNASNNRSSPVQVGALTDWAQVSVSTYSCLATKTDGTLWSWGLNDYGQLGQNNTTNYSSPVQIGALTNWSKVTNRQYFSLAIKTDGTLWAWGNNSNGTLGQNNTIRRSSPVQIGALTTWLNVSAGSYHVLATSTNGSLWSWGSNGNGQLGQNNTTNTSSPAQVGASTSWISISAGNISSLAISG